MFHVFNTLISQRIFAHRVLFCVVVVVLGYPIPSEGRGHGGRPWSPGTLRGGSKGCCPVPSFSSLRCSKNNLLGLSRPRNEKQHL